MSEMMLINGKRPGCSRETFRREKRSELDALDAVVLNLKLVRKTSRGRGPRGSRLVKRNQHSTSEERKID